MSSCKCLTHAKISRYHPYHYCPIVPVLACCQEGQTPRWPSCWSFGPFWELGFSLLIGQDLRYLQSPSIQLPKHLLFPSSWPQKVSPSLLSNTILGFSSRQGLKNEGKYHLHKEAFPVHTHSHDYLSLLTLLFFIMLGTCHKIIYSFICFLSLPLECNFNSGSRGGTLFCHHYVSSI